MAAHPMHLASLPFVLKTCHTKWWLTPDESNRCGIMINFLFLYLCDNFGHLENDQSGPLLLLNLEKLP